VETGFEVSVSPFASVDELFRVFRIGMVANIKCED
jgi:hypothetical protein